MRLGFVEGLAVKVAAWPAMKSATVLNASVPGVEPAGGVTLNQFPPSTVAAVAVHCRPAIALEIAICCVPDGGEPADGLLEHLDAPVWERFESEFLAS